MTRSDIRSIVRTLTGVVSVDLLTDSLCNTLINESLYEIYRRQGSGWPFEQTALSSDGTSPAFDSQFHMAIAYRTSAKVLNFIADTTKRGETFTAEYVGLVTNMEKFYLPKFANPSFTNSTENNLNAAYNGMYDTASFMEDFQRSTRDLTGIYDNELLSDGMLEEIVNVAHTEFVNLRDWKNYKVFQLRSLSTEGTWSSSGELDNAGGNYGLPPSHRLLVNNENYFGAIDTDIFDVPQGHSPAAHKHSKITEVYLTTNGLGGPVQRMVYTDSLYEIDRTTEKIHYTLHREGTEMWLLFAPEQTTANTYVNIVYNSAFARIGTFHTYNSEYEILSTKKTGFAVPPQFQMLLVYRAAQFVLMQFSPEDVRIPYYENMYNRMLDAFISYDQTAHDTRSFSIGERGKDEPRFIPRFRAS